MRLNSFEFMLMNNSLRAASQRWIETPLLIGRHGVLEGQRVLEIGCGRGVGARILLDLGAAEVVGIDIDPRMISLAQARLARHAGRAVAFVGEAEAIEAPQGSFDAVVDYGILHHIPNWPQALKEITRVLRPGGIFYFEDLLKGFVSAWPIRALLTHPQATQFYGRELRAGLEAAGLRVTQWRQWGEWGVIGQAAK